MDTHQNNIKLFSDLFSISNLLMDTWWRGFPDDPRVAEIDFDKKRYVRLLRYYVQAIEKGNAPTSTLREFLFSERDKIEAKIKAVPNNVDKAKDMLRAHVATSRFSFDENDVYDAVVYLRGELDKQLISKIVDNWREDYKKHIEHEARYSDPDDWFHTKIFWFVRTGNEDTEIISRYRAKTYLEIGGFDDVFEEVEEWAENTLRELIQDPIDHLGEYPIGQMVDFLCALSRDEHLSEHLADLVRLALRHLAKGNIPKDWGQYTAELEREKNTDSHSYQIKFNQRPAMDVVVLSALALSKLGKDAKIKQKSTEIANWLLKHQNSEGFWSKRWDPDTGSIKNTVFALEALIRSEIIGIEYSIDKGINWLLSQQNEFGCWEEMRFFPFWTVRVLEVIDLATNWNNNVKFSPNDLQKSPTGAHSKSHFSFICHSSKDDKFVDKLVGDLERADLQTWVDHKDISGLENWNNAIEKALDECSSLLFVMSQNGLDSPECQREWSYVLNNKPVILVILDSKLKLPHRLHLNNGIKFDLGYEKGIEKLVRDLRNTSR